MKYKTKLQRRKIYQKVLENFEICGDSWQCLCCEIQEIILPVPFLVRVPYFFPELLAQKPKAAITENAWWGENQKVRRMKALKAAIKLTYK